MCTYVYIKIQLSKLLCVTTQRATWMCRSWLIFVHSLDFNCRVAMILLYCHIPASPQLVYLAYECVALCERPTTLK